jgi:hypothetical protein
MVEAGGVEPPSKGITTQVSPSAVYDLDFAPLTPTDRLRQCYLDKNFPFGPFENRASGIPLSDALS